MSLRNYVSACRFRHVYDVRHMARIRAVVLRHRHQRSAENYFHVGNNQSFRVRNGGLPLQSEGEVPFDHFEPLENARTLVVYVIERSRSPRTLNRNSLGFALLLPLIERQNRFEVS